MGASPTFSAQAADNAPARQKILVVTTVAATLRGFLLPYAAQLRARGCQVDCLAQGVQDDPLCKEGFDDCHEAVWTRNPLGRRGLSQGPRQVRALVASEGYDVVHVHTPVAAFITRWALRRRRSSAGPRIIYTAHGFHFHRGGSPLLNLAFRRLEKLAARWTDYLVLINDEDFEAALASGFAEVDRLLKMPGIGVDVEAFSRAGGEKPGCGSLQRELGLPEGARLISMVAEFTPNKRQRDLIEAIAYLNRPNVHVLFAGEGPERGRCEQLARKFGVRDRVHFLGIRDDVGRLLAASALSVLPSAREGMPRVVMESLCVGTPVVGTNVRGTRDLVGAGAGKLVSVGAVDELAEAIALLLDNESLRLHMGKRGRELIQSYDLRRTLALHATLYDAALQGKPLPAGAAPEDRSEAGFAAGG